MSDAVAEPVQAPYPTQEQTPLILEDKPAQSPLKFRFSPSNARLNALKSVQARIANRQARLRAEQNKLNPAQEQVTKPAQSSPQPDPYMIQNLGRMRAHLDRLNEKLAEACQAEELDAVQIDKLASAISRLSEIERQLADRPLPGSKRPGVDKSSSGRASFLLGTSPEPAKGAVEQE